MSAQAGPEWVAVSPLWHELRLGEQGDLVIRVTHSRGQWRVSCERLYLAAMRLEVVDPGDVAGARQEGVQKVMGILADWYRSGEAHRQMLERRNSRSTRTEIRAMGHAPDGKA